jgi:hypothetical protein
LDFVILDQAVRYTNPVKILNYFQDIKLVLVDRDPRDIYIELVNKKALIGADESSLDLAKKYCVWHRKLRESVNLNDPRVLILRFEDLVLDYQNTILKISEFIGLDIKKREQFRYFNPANSLKNVHLWKNSNLGREMEYIFNELV